MTSHIGFPNNISSDKFIDQLLSSPTNQTNFNKMADVENEELLDYDEEDQTTETPAGNYIFF